MSTQSFVEKEKIKLTLEADKIPQKEIEDLISETSGLWAKAKDGALSYIPIKLLERICPEFLFNVKEKLETEAQDRVNKKVSFTLKVGNDSYLFGLNETDKDGKAQPEEKQTIWRVKQNPNFQSGGASKGGFAPQPLAELFVGSIAEANQMLKDESKKWYIVDQKIEIDMNTQVPVVYVILKRNRPSFQPSSS